MSNSDTTTTETVEVEVTATEAENNPEVTPVAEVKAPKAAKPPVYDARGENPQRGAAVPVALNQRVKMQGDQDKDEAGKPKLGTITGIEYQRKRVVVKLDTQEKLIVRPASQAFVIKGSNGKVEFDTARMEKAVRGARKTPAEPTADAAPKNGRGKGKGKKAETPVVVEETTPEDAAVAEAMNAEVEAEQVEETVVAEVEVEVEPTEVDGQDEAPAPVE